MIIIIVLEGKDSNTEVNFFKGLNHHFKNGEIKIFPFEKIKDSIKREEEITGLIKGIMRQILILLENFKDQKNKKSKLFFIADGDNFEDIPSIKRTKDKIKEYINNEFNDIIEVENELLLKTGLCFEDLYRKVHPKKWFPSNSKKKSNRNLFKNYAKRVDWFNKNELDFLKIINDMKKTENPHLKIIEAIILEEKL